MLTLATDEELAAARRLHADDDVQIYDDAQVSEADEGMWVEAWVWVPLEAIEQKGPAT